MVICLGLCYWLTTIALFAVEGLVPKIVLICMQFLFFLVACSREDELNRRIKKLEESISHDM